MAVSEEQTQADAREARNSAGITLELAGKGIAAMGIAAYVCGFLITSLNQSRYGFAETNPFRPRIISAGAWFLLLTAIPVFTMMRSWGWRHRIDDWKTFASFWKAFASFLYPYWVGCLTMSIPASMLFTFSDSPPRLAPGWWWRPVAIVLALAIFVGMQQSKKFSPTVLAAVSVALVFYFVQADVRQVFIAGQISTHGAVALWFFGVGVATFLELSAQSGGLPQGNWTKGLVPLFGAVFVFAFFYYPNIKTSWGGGSPVPIVMCFTKESVVKPSQRVAVQLLDESDVGFYILGQNEKRALFIPRSAVSAVYYSDKASDSALLQ
jgi:hypothetical protein